MRFLSDMRMMSNCAWYHCDLCHTHFRNLHQFLVHTSNHEPEGGKTNQLFHTAQGVICLLEELPQSISPEIFIPRISLIPLEKVHSDLLTENQSPNSHAENPVLVSGQRKKRKRGPVRRRKIPCRYCGHMLRMEHFKRHESYCRQGPNGPLNRFLRCPAVSCNEGKGFSNATDLWSHFNVYHTSTEPYNCDNCHRDFATVTSLRFHKIRTLCLKRPNILKTRSRRGIDDNMTSTNLNNPVVLDSKGGSRPMERCPLCGWLMSKYNIQRHLGSCKESAVRWRCPFISCPQPFDTKDEMLSHFDSVPHQPLNKFGTKVEMELTAAARPEVAGVQLLGVTLPKGTVPPKGVALRRWCQYCGEVFKSSNGKYHHKKVVHLPPGTVVTSFSCETCGKRFGRKDHLGRHNKTIHGE